MALGVLPVMACWKMHEISLRDNLLPMGLSEGCRLKKDVAKDQTLSYADVELPPGRLCAINSGKNKTGILAEMSNHFHDCIETEYYRVCRTHPGRR
jgi:predicted homoserine dehydrogenase-like protein